MKPTPDSSRLSSTPAADDARRVAWWMARSGLCSRRGAERMIAEGRVALDGKILLSPACAVADGTRLKVDGRPLPAALPLRLWLFHKPAKVLTTHDDPQGRPCLFAMLPPHMPRVVSVGRLDWHSEGLMLLTTDGGFKRLLESPRQGLKRVYRAKVGGHRPSDDTLAFAGRRLAAGMTVNGVRYRPARLRCLERTPAGAWLEVTVCEGRNREVRRLLSSCGFKVTRLIRVAFGRFHLGALSAGACVEVARRPLAAVARALAYALPPSPER